MLNYGGAILTGFGLTFLFFAISFSSCISVEQLTLKSLVVHIYKKPLFGKLQEYDSIEKCLQSSI